MTTGKALNGKPYAGNPHVRFDEGEVASCTAEASLRRVHCRRQPEAMTRPQVASRSEVARGLRASVCAATPRRGSLLYVVAAAIVALQLPTFARTEIESRKLTSNETYEETLVLNNGVALDLNGYTLTVAGLSGTGFITCSSMQTGVLCVDSDTDSANDSVTIYGNVKFTKDGKGTLTAAKSNQTYWGGTEVKGGTLKRGVLYGAFGSVNLVRNGSFDEGAPGGDATSAAAWASAPDWPENPYWTVSSTNDNHGALTKSALYVASATDIGTYAAVLRTSAMENDAYIRQTIDIPQPGTYSFAFTYIQVEAWPSVRGATVTAVLRHGDDVEVLTPGGVVAKDASGTRFETIVKIDKAGEYILEFGQTSTDTKNTLLDNVELIFISNLVRNGSFDEGAPGGDATSAAAWASTPDWPENPYWTVSSTNDNHGALTKSALYVASAADIGTYAAVLRTSAMENDAYIRQTINIPQPGTYSFAFTYIQVEAWPNVRGATVTAVLRHGDDVEVLTPGGVVANNMALALKPPWK